MIIKKATLRKRNGLQITQSNSTRSGTLPPTLEGRIKLVLDSRLSPQKRRLIGYLKQRPGALTFEIARDLFIAYPTNRLGELNAEILPKFGLRAQRYTTPRRLESQSRAHRWRLEIIPEGQEAA